MKISNRLPEQNASQMVKPDPRQKMTWNKRIIIICHDSQQLQFTEAGFFRCTRKKVMVIPWEEARLFAIVPVSPDMRKTSGPSITYELSSTNEVLHWSTGKHIIHFADQATLTSSERHQQMQALLSVIVAKTKLPLYDLR